LASKLLVAGRLWWALSLGITLLSLSACGGLGAPRGELRLLAGADSAAGRVLFPPSPEVPRYAYVGQLVGEENFAFDRPQEGWFGRLWRAVIGLGREDRVQELTRPQAVVTDGRQRVLVADVGQPSVRIFDPEAGRFLVWENLAPNIPFVSPIGLATQTDGSVWVSDSEHAVVARLSALGEPMALVGTDLLKRPTGLALDEARQRLYVADSQANRIHVFSLHGQLLDSFGERGSAPGEFSGPTFLALHGGELYVADTLNARVQVLDADTGMPLRVIGSRGVRLGQLMLPKGVALDSEQNLYVVDSYFDSLLVFSPQGDLLLHLGGTGYGTGNFFAPSAVFVDERNRVYVADTFNGRVALFQFLGGD